MTLFGLGIAEWVTIIALVASVPLTLKMMARASAAYERKAAERARAADVAAGAGDQPADRSDGKDRT